MKLIKGFMMALTIAGAANGAQASAPNGYYKPCEGKTGQALLTALSGVVSNHTTISYSGLWTLYQTSDVYPNGKIWDMYSTKQYTYKQDQCGSYSVVGSCYNREHSFPKSWFNDASPMVSDAFHIYPTDGMVNGQRSNYPYGECANGETKPASGGIKALGRLGKSTFSGYSGKVFEPDDEYKGDFARTYFYMAAAYNNRISSWKSDMLAGNSYPAFSAWAIRLLLKWHNQDPVSEKEIKRNEVVYGRQKNRNPFIDHPELANYIWGEQNGQAWYPGGAVSPELTLPVNNSSVSLGTTVPGFARTATVNVKGANITENTTVTVAGTGFSASPAVLDKSAVNAGTPVTVTFNPATAGNFTGTLTITCGKLTSRVSLSGNAITSLPAGPVTAIGQDSFEACWSNVGDADERGEYTLDVRLNGVSLDEFPRSVTAADESFTVEDLEPLTTYTYVIKSQHLVSDEVTVTTLAPQPLVEFLFDGQLSFSATPGTPSEVAELLVNIENIASAINVSVTEPFQLSTDKSDWTRSVTLDPEEDRIYLRLYSDRAGQFRTSIVATAGDYMTDDAEAFGVVGDITAFIEDFEEVDQSAASYNPPPYQGSACLWNFKDAGIWAVKSEAHNGDQALRMGKTAASVIEMADEHIGGIGSVSFWAKRYNNDGEAQIELEYTIDNGSTWRSAGTAHVTQSTYSEFSFIVNVSVPARMRLRQTSGARVNIDDIKASLFSGIVPPEVADYHRWDAFCRDGLMVIEASEDINVAIYALDGTLIMADNVAAGSTVFELPAGLYIVAVDDFARRVLIK